MNVKVGPPGVNVCVKVEVGPPAVAVEVKVGVDVEVGPPAVTAGRTGWAPAGFSRSSWAWVVVAVVKTAAPPPLLSTVMVPVPVVKVV